MAKAPRKACPICRVLDCDDPSHVRAADPTGWVARPTDKQRRAGGRTYRERQRRKAVVDEWREQHGDWCPECGRRGVLLTADHIHPVALGGAEDGPLQVLCIDCQRRQGSEVGRQRRS